MKLKTFNYKLVNSTNDLAIRIIKKTNNKSGIVIAEKQKKGRGQYGKKWISFKGNLFISIFFIINDIKLSKKLNNWRSSLSKSVKVTPNDK